MFQWSAPMVFWFNHHNFLFGHVGIEPGATSQIYFYVRNKIGIVLNTNISNNSLPSIKQSINEIWKLLDANFVTLNKAR